MSPTPWLTLSYLTQTVTPNILKQVDEQAAKRQSELLAQLNTAIADYKMAVEGGGASGGTSASYSVVTLTSGQTLALGVGCEVMLRVGTATLAANTDPGLIDVSTGGTLNNGGALTAKIMGGAIRSNIESMGRQFIIGQNVKEAMGGLAKLRKDGFAFTVDLLGEASVNEEESDAYAAGYHEVLDALAEEQKKWARPVWGTGLTTGWIGIHAQGEHLHQAFGPLFTGETP